MLNKTMLAVAILFMLSCSNSPKKEAEEQSGTSISKAVEGVGNLSKLSKSAEKMEALTAKLKNLTPVSKDELKAVVPENIGDFKRKSYSAGNSVADINSVQAEYSKGDEKRISINILDGAGESGSAIVALMAMGLSVDSESEENGTVTKNIEVDGVRYSTEDTKTESRVGSSIKFLHNDRYDVTLTGEGYNLSELQAFLKSLDLSSLK
jgi:hypothetical protein